MYISLDNNYFNRLKEISHARGEYFGTMAVQLLEQAINDVYASEFKDSNAAGGNNE